MTSGVLPADARLDVLRRRMSLGLWAAVRWGVSGAVVGTLLSSTVTGAVLLYFLRGRAMARPTVAGSER